MDCRRDAAADLFDFVEQWKEDRASGKPRSVQEYLQRFPGREEAVAREFFRLQDEADGVVPSAATLLSSAPDRYTSGEEIARGGMGSIRRVHDESLHRNLAMKVALRHGPAASARVEEEAQITSHLDHPGVVPVHEAGVDRDGRSFFTMRLTEGRDLREIIRLVHRGEDGWSLPRALEVLLKVCDTMAFAHARGVVHRDLKPDNVRVGGFGEVYVMDWGLAKSKDKPETRDLRLRPTSKMVGATADAETGAKTPHSPLLTMDGDVVGTPTTMAPEQAAGRVDEIGPRSDVYSMGAMLYELLCGEMPYVRRGERPAPSTVLERVLAGPPPRVSEVAPKAPSEVIAICEKAMSRDPARRYADMREMAEDLRAWLELRVVRAYRTGVLAEIRKWIARNRRYSLAIAAAVLIGVGALTVIAVLQAKSRARLRLLADSRAPADLQARARDLLPTTPDVVQKMERWIEEARELAGRRDAYERELEALRARALPWDPAAPREQAAADAQRKEKTDLDRVSGYYRVEAARMEREGGNSEEGLNLEQVRLRLTKFYERLAALAARPRARLTWTFSSSQDQLRHDAIEHLLPQLEVLLDSPAVDGLITMMQRRLDFTRSVVRETLVDAGAAWAEAIASIRDPRECPLYGGLVIRPQLGLIPLRRDPESNLWEFLHCQSGAAPTIDSNGRYQLQEDTGIVLVLLPGGRFELGAQATNPWGSNYDPHAKADESTRTPAGQSTVHAVLTPFFLSKYEMTQAHWKRLAGRNPSYWTIQSEPRHIHNLLHPVESIDWNACERLLREIALTLPTEAQWEYGARAGTSTPWWTGAERDSLAGCANLADRRTLESELVEFAEYDDGPQLDDGFGLHAPIGSLRPNGFGLHDVCGNVAEWCLDAGHMSYDYMKEVKIDTLERWIWGEGLRVRRGGGYEKSSTSARSAARAFTGPEFFSVGVGLRPARKLE